MTQRRGRRWSAADAYLRPALQRRNLTLRTEACATRVVFEGTTAVGVEIEQGGRTEVLRAGEVLLAAGAVASPALLLRSGIGAAGELAALGIRPVCDLEGVGRNLQDHLVAGLLVESRRPITLAAAERPRSLARYLLTRRGPLSSNVAEAAAFVHSRPGLAAPDLELVFCPVLYVGEGLVPPPGHGFTIGVTGLQPQSVGSVRLRSADPGSPPQINPAYLTDPTGADLAVLGEGFELARRIAAAPAFAQLAGGELAPGELSVEQHVRATAHTMYHPVGTCRMGSDEQSVVDSRLRVHGVEGLRVVDASVMPRIPRGHTNLPTMMVAERAAELLQERGGAARSSRSAQHARAR